MDEAEDRVVDPNVPENRGDVPVDPQVAGSEVPEQPGETPPEPKASQEELLELNRTNQQRYQRMVELVKRDAPEVYEEFREEFPKAGERPAEVAEPEVPEEYESDFVTPGQLRQTEERIISGMKSTFEGYQAKQDQGKVVAQARDDYKAANATLSEFLQANNVTDEQFDWARRRVAPLRIDVGTREKPVPGGAARYGYAVMTLLEPLVHTPEGDAAEAERLARIEADAADKGRTASLNAQPSGAPGGIGTSSASEQLGDRIQPDTPYTASG